MDITKTGNGNVSVDPEIINAAEKILVGSGLSLSKSFELFCRQIIAHKGLPFELHIVNEKTMQAVENSRKGKGDIFSNPEELFKDLGV
jgi:DNA-damage-inducible protein J